MTASLLTGIWRIANFPNPLDTISMERIQVVKDALDGECDEFYDEYVAGRKELSEIKREYSEEYAGSGSDD